MKAAAIILATLITLSASAEGAWAVKKGNTMIWKEAVTGSPEKHYAKAAKSYNSGSWKKAAKEFSLVAIGFPTTSYGQDAIFYLGVCYYQLEEFDLANESFDQYLSTQSNPPYFQEVMDYKFAIAEKFRQGARAHMFGYKRMPKWGSGGEMAVGIYDEVIASVPTDETSAQALYGKGWLLWKQREYRDSIDAFQTLIARFPKNELAPECFLQINRVYLEQCQMEFQNPDLLALAEINLVKFKEQFPGEERLEQASCELMNIKEVYAKGMFDTALFYERIAQPKAAVIYYQKAIIDFPETVISQRCRNRLRTFCPQALVELESMNSSERDPSEEIEFI